MVWSHNGQSSRVEAVQPPHDHIVEIKNSKPAQPLIGGLLCKVLVIDRGAIIHVPLHELTPDQPDQMTITARSA